MKVSKITEFLENAYDVLNNRYFNGELSSVVITIQSSPRTYGHYTKYDTWSDSQDTFKEINLSAENLDRPIENIIATLIHEMVHHYCDQNGIKDVSRGGVYHNKRFKEQAEQRGLIISYDNKIGYSITEPSEELIHFIVVMGWMGIDLSRKGELELAIGGKGRKPSSTRKYICPVCHNSVRATKNVNIGCLDCSEVMVVAE